MIYITSIRKQMHNIGLLKINTVQFLGGGGLSPLVEDSNDFRNPKNVFYA